MRICWCVCSCRYRTDSRAAALVIIQEKPLKSGSKLVLYNTTVGGDATVSSTLAVVLQEKGKARPNTAAPIFRMRHGYDFDVHQPAASASTIRIYYPDSADVEYGTLKQAEYDFKVLPRPSFQGFLRRRAKTSR